MIAITIFTPTYNRASLLPRLFESIMQQNVRDIEWIIVDDGSTDNTEMVVKGFLAPELATFPIKYYRKTNGGKHTAINYGVNKAQGELFFIVDSDDILPAGAIRTVRNVWDEVKHQQEYGGVCGLDGNMKTGTIIGSGIPNDSQSSTMSLADGSHIRYIDGNNMAIRFDRGVAGDMKEIYRTSVLKEFPFPEIPNERFCPEVLVWNRIGTKYKLRYFHHVIYLAEYQADGVTAGITKARRNSPIATMMTYQEMTEYDIPFKWKARSAINYWRFGVCAFKRLKFKIGSPTIHAKWFIFIPVGIIYYFIDTYRLRGK